MKVLLALVAVLLLAAPATLVAPTVPLAPGVTKPATNRIDALPGYDTLEEAGVQGIARAYRCSHVYECGGPIALRLSDGKFVVGPVESSHAGDHVYIDYDLPDGLKLVADYHTHPCNPVGYIPEVFSPADIAGDTSQRITGFMGDLCTGKVHEFTPGKDTPNDTYVPRAGIYSTQGRIIGSIAVDGKIQEPNTGMI